MRPTKIMYWAATALVVLAMVYSAYSDLASPAVKRLLGTSAFLVISASSWG